METTDPAKAAENLLNQIGASGPEPTNGENKKPDIEIIDPDPEHFTLAGRKYEIRPLPIKKLKLLNSLQEADITKADDETYNKFITVIASILNETDPNFIEDNLDMGSMAELFQKIMAINLMAVEKKTKAIRGI